MSRARRFVLARGLALAMGLAMAGALSGCGFHPLYGSMGGGAQGEQIQRDLKLVNVLRSPERIGQLMRQAVQERLEGTGAPLDKKYDLQLILSFTEDAMGIEQDGSVTRIRFTGAANYVLRREDKDRSVMVSGSVKLLDAINVFDNQPFASDLETETVEKRMTQNLADLIVEKLAVYFRKHPGGQ